ncbi:MAG TPA: DNA topoisomerase [Ignavibacteriales bacterium]|nr:DNA topoisomerase [Ignavibacteriales bacterium]
MYELVWQRFLASQMSSAILETTSINIKAGEFLFRASGSAIVFEGFLSAYEEQNEEAENAEENGSQKIPLGLKAGDVLSLLGLEKNQHFTKPLPRFTESSLIKELESLGIGRPSTYAGIVGTIQERKYVNMEERKLVPTGLGKKVNKILVKSFPEILNVNFTAKMEDELDQIANGENEYAKVLAEFYDPFSKALVDFENKIEKIRCDKCGSDMEIKVGRFGKYLACTNYPTCTNIKSIREVQQENQEPEYTGETCEKCGARTVYRYGKFGKFIGCERFPDCDFIKPVTLGITCPKCHKGEIVERKSKRGKVFYGCSSYPDCDFAAWHKPEIVACPNNDSEYMERRYTAKKGEYLKCPVCGEEVKIESNNSEESNNDE